MQLPPTAVECACTITAVMALAAAHPTDQSGCWLQAGPGEKGDVRVSLVGDGYWSYLGTDVLLIPDGMPTMNLQGFSMSTPESEYKCVSPG